ncbi:hypothetical protein TWF694_009081 [Orbilia ellipsospora]|uniref:Uncharacterized protein n=1 Tax=Orbilia ellipsospora TaxID=2528407 RepID=A0AAV9XED6_9PEZI
MSGRCIWTSFTNIRATACRQSGSAGPLNNLRQRYYSQVSNSQSASKDKSLKDTTNAMTEQDKKTPTKMTVAEADEALRKSMGDIDGGGESSVEMEGGKFVGLRKGVKDNMFRLI